MIRRIRVDALDPDPFRVASNASNTPLRTPVSPPAAPKPVIRATDLADPFANAEGRFHHRRSDRLAQRCVDLEAEIDRQSNIISDLADRLAEAGLRLADPERCVCGSE